MGRIGEPRREIYIPVTTPAVPREEPGTLPEPVPTPAPATTPASEPTPVGGAHRTR
jgi:hypothetical protein